MEAGQTWEKVSSEAGPDLVLFRARFDWMRHPHGNGQLKAVVLETADWVNVVALTPQGKILTVRQYRFGVEQVTTEIPAGLIEAGEESGQAARRELAEETGYTSTNWQYLGNVQANPAFLNNTCHFWLASDAVCTQPPDPDESEDVAVSEVSLDELLDDIRSGQTRNAFTLLALAQVFDLRGALVSGTA
jgi:ADP-ribose pyrophosphatase